MSRAVTVMEMIVTFAAKSSTVDEKMSLKLLVMVWFTVNAFLSFRFLFVGRGALTTTYGYWYSFLNFT